MPAKGAAIPFDEREHSGVGEPQIKPFDWEDPFALDDGVEYLFGVLEPGRADPERPDEPLFHEIWSRDDAGEVTRAAE